MNHRCSTDQIENLIRSGQTKEARLQLQELAKGKIEREDRSPIATLARRLSLHHIALRVLNPVVRPERPLLVEATKSELITYASALILSGSQNEGLEILDRCSPKESPEVLLYKSFAHIRNWNYGSSIPLLERYCRKDLTPYQVHVAQINLASAYLFQEKYDQAIDLTDQILSESQPEQALLKLAAYQILAQSQICQNNWEQAIATINQAKSEIEITEGINHLLIEKWLNISYLYKDGITDARIDNLKKVQQKAKDLKHWETIRDCDLYIGLITQDDQLLNKVYYGSPYQSFKKRMIGLSDNKFSPRPSFGYNLFNFDQFDSNKSFDLSYENLSSRGLLKSSYNLRLIRALTQDLYNPPKMGSLHSCLFPGEYFNPFSSSNRVSQAIHRFNQWSKNEELPIKITSKDQLFSLKANADFSLKVYKNQPWDPLEIKLSHLKSLFRHKEFSAQKAAEALNCSSRKAISILNEGIEQNLVKVHGKTRSRRFRF